MTESALPPKTIYAVMAEFKDANSLLHAAASAYEAGYRRIDAYSPFPIHGLAEAMGHRDKRVQLLVLLGGLAGLAGGYLLQYWISVIDYPMNVGGRPLHSWPAFIVPTFETTILFASITAVVGMLALNGLPRPYHPVFNVPRFREHASSDGFFFVIEATDPKFDAVATRRALGEWGAGEITDVEA